jgi:hypothetical protein
MAKSRSSKRSAKPTAALTPATIRRLNLLFAAENRGEAARLLREQCGNNLPFLEKATPRELDRFRYAALKLSDGDLKRLRWAIKMAQIDWRDLLVTASFAEDADAHRKWLPTRRQD